MENDPSYTGEVISHDASVPPFALTHGECGGSFAWLMRDVIVCKRCMLKVQVELDESTTAFVDFDLNFLPANSLLVPLS